MNEPAKIIEMNISRSREMLKLALDEGKRATVERLLAKAELDLEDRSWRCLNRREAADAVHAATAPNSGAGPLRPLQ